MRHRQKFQGHTTELKLIIVKRRTKPSLEWEVKAQEVICPFLVVRAYHLPFCILALDITDIPIFQAFPKCSMGDGYSHSNDPPAWNTAQEISGTVVVVNHDWPMCKHNFWVFPSPSSKIKCCVHTYIVPYSHRFGSRHWNSGHEVTNTATSFQHFRTNHNTGPENK